MNNVENFKKWMRENNYKSKTIGNYKTAIDKIDEILEEELGKKMNIYDISRTEDVEQVIERDKKEHSRYSCALKSYKRFIDSAQSDKDNKKK